MILPFMEKNDVYRSMAQNIPSSVYLSFYTCPSTPPDNFTEPWLAYAGNVGSASNLRRADGVMLDTTVSGTGRLSLDDISAADGSTNTLVLAEKCSSSNHLVLSKWNNQPGNIFEWYGAPGFGIVGGVTAVKVINHPNIGNANSPGQMNLPSSNHPGGAVVAFCDGHTGFLKDSLRKDVYAQLLSWDDATAVNTTPASRYQMYMNWTAGYRILSDRDFQ